MAINSPLERYGYIWVTLGLFFVSLVGHWAFAWPVYRDEQVEHGQAPEVGGFVEQTARDTLENWQSEFLQLIWQVLGLAFLLSVGSPQSKEGDDRREEKLDNLLRLLDERKGEDVIARLDKKYAR